MAFVTKRKHPQSEILSLLPIPLYVQSNVYYEEDLEEMGLDRVLDGLSEERRHTVLEHARRLALIQPELAFHFLSTFPEILRLIPEEELGRWVSVVLDIYDSKGLNPAREFLLELDRHPDFGRYWGEGVPFQEVGGILLNYLHALGREEIALEEGKAHYTSVEAIHLPERNRLLSDKKLNFLLYKVMVTHKFAQVHLGTYRIHLDDLSPLAGSLRSRYRQEPDSSLQSDLSRFFHLFPHPVMARDLFALADTARIEKWTAHTLPGLYRDLTTLKRQPAMKPTQQKGLPPKSRAMAALFSGWLAGAASSSEDPGSRGTVAKILRILKHEVGPDMSAEGLAQLVARIYPLMEEIPGPYVPIEPIPYVGEVRAEEAERGRRRKRESTKLAFRQELAKLIRDLPECEDVRIEIPGMEEGPLRESPPRQQEIPNHLLINDNPVPVPEAMQKIIREIYEDLGSIPAPYLAVADDMSGHYFRSLCQMPEGTGYVLSETGEGIHAIDEWDYRRQGYRKHWALLRETEATGGDLDFAKETLKRYGGMVQRIRRQFERIRMDQILLRRQREGDDVDLDAAVEAFSDRRAGLHPSERVFVRLRRNKRDIATAFLIDLSGSTNGWINEMERASLLILSEAMGVLQDRFAIYGFSGRTRKRCELFRVKGFEEPYGESIQGRIANLSPREYTRMGPPIRHLTQILGEVEARTRLLITLSDGKPDDWDGYNGDYGIEDTRQALLEAKRKDIHPFCITIDKAEHSYLSHMYGPVNYVFIDNLSKLPLKVPEIYRKLTT
jgi:nitric oxide reductase NorD protein